MSYVDAMVAAAPTANKEGALLTWRDKAARDAAWEKIMKDERMANQQMPFDGKRLTYGGFAPMLEV